MSDKHYSLGEEIANSVTHGLGIAAAIVALVLMLVKGIPVLSGAGIAAISVYGATLILMFIASTLYHAIYHIPTKAVLKRVDHCAIYLLIAGSYTPFLSISLEGGLSSLMLVFIWALALVGVIFKILFVHRFKRLSLLTYLGMGWASVLMVPQLYKALPAGGFSLLVLGGVCYSIGALFYAAKGRAYSHAIWHVFVLAGAVLQCLSVALFVIPGAAA
ncbi:PAQR family membrane homeostasis protein TrhA [Aliagarivorans marinus]|uniref:PAQR family membrane homeostasis protein TrhA n=1 Tax=Aliagarivorans marinus TaxID=561965 RepID=UPI00041BE1FF|nr:hemolysin III family protein [Aliagarivorans marinus]